VGNRRGQGSAVALPGNTLLRRARTAIPLERRPLARLFESTQRATMAVTMATQCVGVGLRPCPKGQIVCMKWTGYDKNRLTAAVPIVPRYPPRSPRDRGRTSSHRLQDFTDSIWLFYVHITVT